MFHSKPNNTIERQVSTNAIVHSAHSETECHKLLESIECRQLTES